MRDTAELFYKVTAFALRPILIIFQSYVARPLRHFKEISIFLMQVTILRR